jgi:hypothetical protein
MKKLLINDKKGLFLYGVETPREVGVNLKEGYNGDLTSREAGSVGGQMVKKMIEAYENSIRE